MSEDWFIKIKRGDVEAFNALFKMHYKTLVNIAYKYLKDVDRSKDVSQEVFLDLWKRRGTITINDSIEYFLKRAVVNQSLSILKKNKRRVVDSKVVESNLKIHDSTSESIEFNDLDKNILKILDSLPERCRQVFKLSRYENLSHKQISMQLDISTKTIENQITKALKVMRLELKKLGFLSFILMSTSI